MRHVELFLDILGSLQDVSILLSHREAAAQFAFEGAAQAQEDAALFLHFLRFVHRIDVGVSAIGWSGGHQFRCRENERCIGNEATNDGECDELHEVEQATDVWQPVEESVVLAQVDLFGVHHLKGNCRLKAVHVGHEPHGLFNWRKHYVLVEVDFHTPREVVHLNFRYLDLDGRVSANLAWKIEIELLRTLLNAFIISIFFLDVPGFVLQQNNVLVSCPYIELSLKSSILTVIYALI